MYVIITPIHLFFRKAQLLRKKKICDSNDLFKVLCVVTGERTVEGMLEKLG